jgi:hypothetical protein
MHCRFYLSLYGSAALVDFGRFYSFLNYTQLVGFLGRGISPLQGPYLHIEQKHRTKAYTDIHASSGIRTHDSSGRAGADGSYLIPRRHYDRQQRTN